MKRYIKKIKSLSLVLGIMVFNNSCIFAQTSPSRQGKAVYLVTQSPENNVPYICEGELIFDEKSSVYADGKNVRDTEDVQKYDENGILFIYKGRKGGSDDEGTVFYSDFVRGRTVQQEFFHGRPFIISDTLRTPNWTLLDDTKEINGMKCQKAKATVHGREYETWFSTDIPISYGPWKLHGLPGLILEAHSTDGEVDFELKEIHPVLDAGDGIVPPSKGEHIEGYAFFFTLQDTKTEEFLKATQAKIAALQQSGAIDSDSSVNISAKIRRIEKTPTF